MEEHMVRIPLGYVPGGKTTETFEKKLADARSLIEFLEKNGLRAGRTRLGEYVSFYERLLSGDVSETEQKEKLLFVLREMDEWKWIYKGLLLHKTEGMLKLVRQAIGGPAFAREECSKTLPRNIQLELRVASYFLQAGFNVTVSGPADLQTEVARSTVFVECKRLNSPKKVNKRAKDASRQLRRRYRAKRRSFGMVVLDVSRVIHPKQGIVSGPSELVVRDGMRAQLVDFDRQYDTSAAFKGDRKLIFVWMQAIAPAFCGPDSDLMTIFSSLHSIYAVEGQKRWKLFQEMRPALEVR